MKRTRLLIVLLCLASLLPTANYFAHQKAEQIKKRKQDVLKQQLVYWEKIASDSPTYRDAYLQLAIGNLQLGDKKKAQEFLKTVLKVDPNWQVPASLSALLSPLLQ